MGSSISKRMLGQVSRYTRFVPQQLSYNIVPLPYLKETQQPPNQVEIIFSKLQVKEQISTLPKTSQNIVTSNKL